MEEERNEEELIVNLLKDKVIILTNIQTSVAYQERHKALAKLVQEFEATTGTFLKIEVLVKSGKLLSFKLSDVKVSCSTVALMNY